MRFANSGFEDFHFRAGHWVIADLKGKGGDIRTIPVPAWMKHSVDGWTFGAGINAGTLLQSINEPGRARSERAKSVAGEEPQHWRDSVGEAVPQDLNSDGEEHECGQAHQNASAGLAEDDHEAIGLPVAN